MSISSTHLSAVASFNWFVRCRKLHLISITAGHAHATVLLALQKTLQIVKKHPFCVLLYMNLNYNADLLEEEELVWV